MYGRLNQPGLVVWLSSNASVAISKLLYAGSVNTWTGDSVGRYTIHQPQSQLSLPSLQLVNITPASEHHSS